MKNFITTQNWSRSELQDIINFSIELKNNPYQPLLKNKSVALLFLNPSMRTKTSFEIGISELSGTAVLLQPGKDAWSIEFEENIVMDGETEIIKQGIVVLLKGNESTMIHHGNLTQNGEGPMFGRSIAGGGDWDGDGYLDLAVSNTGTVEEPIGYSSLEFYQGGPNGISTNVFKSFPNFQLQYLYL